MKPQNSTKWWVILAVFILIVLLLLWLTEAFSVGDTDVSAESLAYISYIV